MNAIVVNGWGRTSGKLSVFTLTARGIAGLCRARCRTFPRRTTTATTTGSDQTRRPLAEGRNLGKRPSAQRYDGSPDLPAMPNYAPCCCAAGTDAGTFGYDPAPSPTALTGGPLGRIIPRNGSEGDRICRRTRQYSRRSPRYPSAKTSDRLSRRKPSRRIISDKFFQTHLSSCRT